MLDTALKSLARFTPLTDKCIELVALLIKVRLQRSKELFGCAFDLFLLAWDGYLS